MFGLLYNHDVRLSYPRIRTFDCHSHSSLGVQRSSSSLLKQNCDHSNGRNTHTYVMECIDCAVTMYIVQDLTCFTSTRLHDLAWRHQLAGRRDRNYLSFINNVSAWIPSWKGGAWSTTTAMSTSPNVHLLDCCTLCSVSFTLSVQLIVYFVVSGVPAQTRSTSTCP